MIQQPFIHFLLLIPWRMNRKRNHLEPIKNVLIIYSSIFFLVHIVIFDIQSFLGRALILETSNCPCYSCCHTIIATCVPIVWHFPSLYSKGSNLPTSFRILSFTYFFVIICRHLISSSLLWALFSNAVIFFSLFYNNKVSHIIELRELAICKGEFQI